METQPISADVARMVAAVVRASLEDVSVQETVRHLADNITEYSDMGLRDDATMLLIEYRSPTS